MCFSSQMDPSEVKISEEAPTLEVPDLEVSLTGLLQSCMETNTFLASKVKSAEEVDSVNQSILSKFESVENRKLYLKLLQTSLSFMNLKFVLEIVKSPGFGRVLIKHFQLQSNRKSRGTSGDSSESDNLDNEFSGLIKNLKSLLQNAQRKNHPAIVGNVTEGELERALNIMHNSILYQKLCKKEGRVTLLFIYNILYMQTYALLCIVMRKMPIYTNKISYIFLSKAKYIVQEAAKKSREKAAALSTEKQQQQQQQQSTSTTATSSSTSIASGGIDNTSNNQQHSALSMSALLIDNDLHAADLPPPPRDPTTSTTTTGSRRISSGDNSSAGIFTAPPDGIDPTPTIFTQQQIRSSQSTPPSARQAR